jgi:hypothetical protein
MKKILFALCLLCNCSPANDSLKKIFFDELDFTFDNGWQEAYSMRINKNGLVVIKMGRWGNEYQKGTLSEKAFNSLERLITIIPFEKYDTAYRANIVDQVSYKIVLSNFKSSNKNQHIYIYGDMAPTLIKELSSKIQEVKSGIRFNSLDTAVSFLSERGFYPPGHYFKP